MFLKRGDYMTKGQRIQTARKNVNLSQTEFATQIGVSKQTLYKYENDIITNIPSDKIELIAKFAKVTPEYIMGWVKNANSVNYLSINNIEPFPKMKKVPLLGTIACGKPITAEENIEDYINMPEDTNGTFALRCKGDSMINARIFDGDIVYIREQPDVENGQIGAVLIDGEATLKRVYKYENRIELRAENPTFAPLNFENDELNRIRIIGKAVGFYSKVF